MSVESALFRLYCHPKVQGAVKSAAVVAAQSVLAPAAGGFLGELGLTSLGTSLVSLGGGTTIAAVSASIGTVLAPVAIGVGAIASVGWLYSKVKGKKETTGEESSPKEELT